MQVAHSVDLEHVREHWHEEHVRQETNSVLLEVLEEVDWTHEEGQGIDREHDHTSKH